MKKYNYFKYILCNFIFSLVTISILLVCYTIGYLGENTVPIFRFLPSLIIALFLSSLFFPNDLSLFINHVKKTDYHIEALIDFKQFSITKGVISSLILALLALFHIMFNVIPNGIIIGVGLGFVIINLFNILSLKLSIY